MPVADYPDLVFAATEYVGRADMQSVVSRLVGMAEIEMERQLRLSDQYKTATITLTSGVGDLPTDFYAVRSVRTTSGQSINLKAISRHLDTQPTEDAEPGYMFEAGKIVVIPRTTAEIMLDYFAKLPRLTAALPTNWLLARAPDLYLSGVVYQAFVWAGDADRAAMARQQFMSSLAAVQNDENMRRFVNGRIVTTGGLP